jgi:hypothetical protein
VYTARVNQTFSTTDKVLEITYDGGSGTLANVLADMTMLVGSTAGAHDKGIVRVRSIDSTKVYIGETSHVAWADNLYLTILRDWSLWARHVLISGTTAYMDGGIAYTDQHTKFDPVPIMGCHRVLKLTGASVSTQWNFANSYVPGSTISTYATSAPSASATSGLSTSTPTTTFNAVGWHPVYLTLTAANGKTFWAIRWVYVWSEASPPPSVAFTENPRQDAETGGWQFQIRMSENVDVASIRERALIIVFEEGWYGTTKQSIGQLTGCENIVVTGWIGGEEEISWNPLQGSVTLTGYTAHYWFGKIPSYPDGVRFTTVTPSRWTEIKDLTLDKGLNHFLRWRTTATRIMDVQLTGDTRLTAEIHSMASTLWEQLREIGWLQIFARAGVDRFNRLFIEVHPQMVPEADRSWATVMTITKEDLAEEIDFKRVTVPQNSFVDLSGVAVNSNGKGAPYFSLSPGHTYPPYGTPDIVDHLLVASQENSNTLAGLYRGWLNNELPDLPAKFLANNRMIDCFPRQKYAIVIDADDTPRGVAYTINLLPKEVTLVMDPATGRLHTEVTFEAETFKDLAINGDIPGVGTVSVPPLAPLPPLPPIEIIVPGTIEATLEGPPKLLLADRNMGLLYSDNFNALSPGDVEFATRNAGLLDTQYKIINIILLNRATGEIYVAHRRRTGLGTSPFIAYAPSIGSTFTIIEDVTTIAAKYPSISPDFISVNGIGLNPLTGQVVYVIGIQGNFGGDVRQVYVGSGTSFSAALDITTQLTISSVGTLSFGHDNWRLGSTPNNTNVHHLVLSADGSTIVRDVDATNTRNFHIPISTTDAVFMLKNQAGTNSMIKITQNGAVAGDLTTYIGSDLNNIDFWDNHVAIDPTGMLGMASWDTGQRGKTSDGFATIVGMPTLPFGGDYAYDYAGGAGAESRWIAGNGILRYSPDFGNSWINREGNLLTIAPIPSISIVKVVEY